MVRFKMTLIVFRWTHIILGRNLVFRRNQGIVLGSLIKKILKWLESKRNNHLDHHSLLLCIINITKRGQVD